MEKDIYKTSRLMYILESALEYFIFTLVTGAYIAKVATAIGFSDATVGMFSTLATLSCSFQIFAVFLAKKTRVKRIMTVMHTVNQLCFALMYLVPGIDVPYGVKAVVFAMLILVGCALRNVVLPGTTNWFMTLVDEHKRGVFTANKEIISLLGGMVFTMSMGAAIDYFEAKGDQNGAFVLCSITIFVLTLLHLATLLIAKEKPVEIKEGFSKRRLMAELLRDKTVMKVIMVSVLWGVAMYSSTPFRSTYSIKELGMSMTLITAVASLSSLCRAAFSRSIGKYADKRSFTKMLNICFSVALLAFAVNVFCVPSNGVPTYIAYHVLYAIAMAGINSGGINLIYEYVSPEKRMVALAIKNTLVGVLGFATTFVCGLLVDYIQNRGNVFFGINVYAQQVTSLISVILTVFLIVYLNVVVGKTKKQEETQ